MKELKCTNCGAALTPDGKCEYCGAQFWIERSCLEPLQIRVMEPKVVPLLCETLIGRRIVMEHGQAAAEMAKHDMAYKMAAELEHCMDLEISDESTLDAVRVRGTIRVVLPGVKL